MTTSILQGAALPFLWAHRGASYEAPENTMEAFEAAVTAGADGIEFDVQLSADGHPVVIHDATVERTTGGRGRVSRLSRERLGALDAGGWFAPRFAGARIPSLEEVLRWAPGGLVLNLELKAAGAASRVLECLRDFPDARVILSSFNLGLLQQLRSLDSSVALALVFDTRFWGRRLRHSFDCGLASVHPRHDLVTEEMVNLCGAAGASVFPWTVDDLSEAQRLVGMGVKGLFTNDPARMAGLKANAPILREKGSASTLT